MNKTELKPETNPTTKNGVKPRRRRLPKWLVPAAVILALFTFFFFNSRRPQTVQVANPELRTITETVAASGRVRGDVESNVGSNLGGRVEALLVREGDRVRAGQPLARLDDDALRAQVDQAQAAVLTAEAGLAQASRRPLASEFARLRADVNQSVRVAEARLAAARQRLAELRNGARPEEIDQAEQQWRQAQAQREQARAGITAAQAQIGQAEAQREQAQLDLERARRLVTQGALPSADLDRATTAFAVADRGVQAARSSLEAANRTVDAAERNAEAAQARLRLLRAGSRAEAIRQAQADVEAAEATLRGERRSGEAQLETLASQPRMEDVQTAQARVAEARRNLELARARLAEAIITAPFSGTVAKTLVEEGGVTGPNQPVLKLVRISEPEIRMDVDESHLARLRLGQTAKVFNPAFPNDLFDATVAEIGAEVDSERGTVEVRLHPKSTPPWLKAGLTLDANIIIAENVERLIVPLTAINMRGLESYVYVVENGRATQRPVKLGPSGAYGAPVLEGLTRNDQVITSGGVEKGARVSPKPAPEVRAQ